MRIYWHELKKLLTSVAVWGFVAACLLFNIVIIGNSGDQYADFVSAVSKDTGYILDQSFYEKLARIAESGKQSEYLEQLQHDTDGVTDVFEGYETKSIGERYIQVTGSTGYFAKLMLDKYSALQKVVNEKAKNDESLTLYFAGATHYRHQLLFSTLMGWLLTEGALVSGLLVLLSVGYEQIHGTESIVYSTKKGRQVLRPKLAASVSAGLGVFALLALLTFLIYFSVNEYEGVWRSSVSSLFNYRIDLVTGNRPFITWYSFSILTYFMAMLGMGLGLVLCFSLLAFGIGMWVRNSYIAFLVFLVVNAVTVVIPLQIPQTMPVGLAIKYFAVLTPTLLWLKHGIWFTDGDIDIVWKHFETLGLVVSLVVLTALCVLAVNHFKRKDFT